MKNIFKHLFTFILVFTFVFSGCGNASSEVTPEPDPKSYGKAEIFETIDNSKISRYQSVNIALKEGYERAVLASSNTSVAIIEDGAIVGLNVGTSVLSATLNGFRQEQVISVVRENSIEFDIDNLPVLLDDTYNISITTFVDNKVLDGATYTFSSQNSSVATVSNGALRGVSLGETDITVNVIWREQTIATKAVSCSVNNNDAIYTNKTEYQVYSLAKVLDTDFNKTANVVSSIYIGGEKRDNLQVYWTSADETIASINDNGVITAVNPGETFVVGTCMYGQKNVSTRRVPVKVLKPYLNSNIGVLFDVNLGSGEFDTNTVLGTGYSVGKVVNLENNREYNAVNNALDLVNFPIGDYRVAVYEENEAFAVELDLVVADKILRNRSDLIDADWNSGDFKYVALANDITNVGKYENAKRGESYKNGRYVGVINGMGHKIDGLLFTYVNQGIVSTITDTTIKNIAIIAESQGERQAALFWRSNGTVRIDNVYVDLTFTNKSVLCGGFCDIAFGIAYFSNCFVITHGVENDPDIVNRCGAAMARTGNPSIYFDNVYCISECKFVSEYTSSQVTNNTRYDFYNNKYQDYIFSDEEEFVRARNNGKISFDGFNAYWDLTSLPKFKTV